MPKYLYTIHMTVTAPSGEAADEFIAMMRWFAQPPGTTAAEADFGNGIVVDAEDGTWFGDTETLDEGPCEACGGKRYVLGNATDEGPPFVERCDLCSWFGADEIDDAEALELARADGVDCQLAVGEGVA